MASSARETAGSEYRNPPAPSGDLIVALSNTTFLPLWHAIPDIKLYTRTHPFFKSLNTYFHLELSASPHAIVRPTTEEQISQIIRFCRASKYSFTVRCGGHDSWGRSAGSATLIIDVREVDTIVLAGDKQSVRIGGGTISENLTKFLAPHGLVAVQGGCSSVGYTNWAACGGYSALNGMYGMGCDQIIGARLVNASGEIVDADEETLWGLRGGGCNFGVVVSLDIRVYQLRKMLAGLLVFPVEQARGVLLGYMDVLEERFPDAYGGLMGMMAIPGMGTMLMFMFTWNSEDSDAGWAFLERLKSLGNAVMDTVKETTLAAWTEVGKAFSPTFIYTNIRTAYVKNLSENFIYLLLRHTARIPTGTKAMFIIHIVHGKATKPTSNSCFGMREPHIWVGIHGQTLEESNKHEAYAWSDAVVANLKQNSLMMRGGYVAQMGPKEPVEDCFGDNWERLKELMKKLDQDSVFRYAVPSLI